MNSLDSPSFLDLVADRGPLPAVAIPSAVTLFTQQSVALATPQPLEPSDFPNKPSKRSQPPPCTIANVRYLLASYDVQARYNVVTKKLLITVKGHAGSPDNFDNVAMTYIFSLAALHGMQTGHLAAMVEAIGDANQFNPVVDWILSKPWDGEDRLPAISATLVQRPGFPELLKKIVVHKWLLSAAAAALKPVDFHTRGVLTLQGRQSIGKTAWIKALVPDAALCRQVVKVDHHMDASNKDSLLSAVAHWLVEIGELDSSFKKDVARLKGFLTSNQDKVRRPYARVDSEYPRRTVFAATVNDENFLVDTTGNTRFMTIPVVSIDHQHRIDMQQVFAQLAVEYSSGVEWWLTPQEEEWLEEQNKAHRAVSVIRDLLTSELDWEDVNNPELKARTASEVLKAVGIRYPTNPQARECGAILRELLGEPKMVHNQPTWRVPLRDPTDGVFDRF